MSSTTSSRDPGQRAVADDVVGVSQTLDRVDATGERVVRAEEQLVRDPVLLGHDHHVVELPGAVVDGRDVGVDVRVLADHHQAFLAEGMPDVRQHHPQLRELDRHLVEQPRPRELQRRRRG